MSLDAQAFWDVPVYTEHAFVSANRIDARFVNHKTMQVLAEMSCPSMDNRERKEVEKTEKYGSLLLKCHDVSQDTTSFN